ncbi:helix-turn-helix domain-containing protein [Robertmurraya beringensis]|uniref:Helix-turn-helix domain-containing protein n=1 Tax=Robertmurraya beringensis TaxID=641660 RepID=A0ABV6KTN3_9BACI
MEDIAKVIGQNIERLKQSKGLTNEDIGNIIGVTRVTVAKYLSGDQVIDSARLFRLANKYNLPLKWFLVSDEESMSFMFRADNPQENFDDDLAHYLNKFLNEYIRILELAGENNLAFLPQAYKLHLKENKLTDDDHELIKEIAEKQRKAFGVDEVIDYDIYSILEKNNINVLALRLYNSKIFGLSAYSEDKGAFIIINDHPDIPEERKIFSAVHELGHLIFHREDYDREPGELAYSKSRNNINEKVVDNFSSYFLIPRNQLKGYKKLFRGFISNFSNVYEVKKEFGVSAKALLMALKEEGYIEQKTFGALFNNLKRMGFDFKEPQPIEYIEKNKKMKSILRRLYLEDKVTTNKVAELLLLNDKEARLLVKAWAEEEDYGDQYTED